MVVMSLLMLRFKFGLRQTTIGFAHDLIDGDNDVRDNCSYHGTHVLGIVGGKGAAEVYGVTGVASDATYNLYRIASCGPRGASTVNLMKATLEAADRGVDILSCSYGGGLAFPDGERLPYLRNELSTDHRHQIPGRWWRHASSRMVLTFPSRAGTVALASFPPSALPLVNQSAP